MYMTLHALQIRQWCVLKHGKLVLDVGSEGGCVIAMQGDGGGWGGLSSNPSQAAMQAQALAALQLQLAGGLDQGAGPFNPGAPTSLTAFAQQHLLQQQLQNLSLQTNLSLQQNTAALLAKVSPASMCQCYPAFACNMVFQVIEALSIDNWGRSCSMWCQG